MPKNIPEEIKNLIINLANEGNSKKEIEEKTGVSRTAIYNILNDEKIIIEQDNSQDEETGEKLSEKIVTEGYDLNDELIQLIFNLKRLANKSGTTLKEFLGDIERITDNYYRFSRNTTKLFDFFMDVSSNLNLDVIAESVEIDKLIELIENFIDEKMYLNELHEKYETIEKFKKKVKKKLERERQFQEKQFEKAKKIIFDLQEIINKQNFALEQLYNENNALKQEKNVALEQPKDMEDVKALKVENFALKQVFAEFEKKFPNEVVEYVKEIKKREGIKNEQ